MMKRERSSVREEDATVAHQRSRLRKWTFRISLLVLVPVLVLAGLIGYYYFRPNTAHVNPGLRYEFYPVVADGRHNSNTDLIYWHDAFWMIHASSPWHFGSHECKLVLWRSTDAKDWERIREFHAPNRDIRDPKFAPIGNKLYLYALINDGFMATPFETSMTSSEDGRTWTEIRKIEPKGWLFWRPKSFDGKTWYCPAYWYEHGKSMLFKSENGEDWTEVGPIYTGAANDETAIEFLPDGRMICTARLEVTADAVLGNPDSSTLISISKPPYTDWKQTKSYVTRLDGPRLFSYKGDIYAIARHNPQPNRFPTYRASTLGKKRTALYKVEPERLVYLSSLPSAGDTSYAGAVVQGDTLYVSYYTSNIHRDWPWLMGMLMPSDIDMARIELPSLAALGNGEK